MESTSGEPRSERARAIAAGKELRRLCREDQTNGLSNAAIAQKHGVAESTVQTLLAHPARPDTKK